MPAQKRKQPSINLLPGDDTDLTLSSRIIRWVLSTFRFLVITVEIVVIVGFLSRFFLDSRNADLTDEINQKRALLESYLPFEHDFKLAQERLSMFNEYAYADTLFSEYVNEAIQNLPEDSKLTKLTRTGPEVTLIVVAKSEQSIAAFVQKLKSAKLMSDVSVQAIESVDESNLIQATLKSGIKTNNEE